MSLISSLRKSRKIILTVAVTIIAILCRKYISYFSFIEEKFESHKSIDIFSQEQLIKYNGVEHNNLYLAVVGTVFDVSEAPQHYGKGAPYHYFVGKDGTRGLVSGIFTDESDEKDHILDLSCNDIFSIVDWRKTFRDKYPSVGLLVGRYYDKYGRETDYMRVLKKKLKQCKEEKEIKRKEELLYPPCNISWNEDEGTRVWCTTSSGGIVRSWVGVPRQLYSPGEEKSHCVCVQLERANNNKMLKPYSGCPDTSEKCFVQEK